MSRLNLTKNLFIQLNLPCVLGFDALEHLACHCWFHRFGRPRQVGGTVMFSWRNTFLFCQWEHHSQAHILNNYISPSKCKPAQTSFPQHNLSDGEGGQITGMFSTHQQGLLHTKFLISIINSLVYRPILTDQ